MLNKFFYRIILLGLMTGCLLSLQSCTTPPPNNTENICSIFRQYPEWYWDAQEVQKHWKLPIYVLMAIMYQESRFNATAKPPREKLLWIIPWKRPTSAYGYSQAVNSTWKHYKRDTNHTFVNRDAFGDAADFIGWYSNQAHIQLGISKWDANALYLAYHEGIGGYSRGTQNSKPWLLAVAKKVQNRAWIYKTQLLQCQSSLPNKPWYHVW